MTTDITALIAELGRLAPLATQGPWRISTGCERWVVQEKRGCIACVEQDRRYGEANVSWIATANPAAIQALLSHIEGLAAQVEGLRESAQEYLANDGSQGTYDAMKLYDVREVLKARLTQTPAHSLASHDAELLERVAVELENAYFADGVLAVVRNMAKRIRAEAGGDGV